MKEPGKNFRLEQIKKEERQQEVLERRLSNAAGTASIA
jgi:hypothetical protein